MKGVDWGGVIGVGSSIERSNDEWWVNTSSPPLDGERKGVRSENLAKMVNYV